MRESSIKNAVIFLTTCCLVYVLKDVLTPFLIALFIAYLINPLITFIQMGISFGILSILTKILEMEVSVLMDSMEIQIQTIQTIYLWFPYVLLVM